MIDQTPEGLEAAIKKLLNEPSVGQDFSEKLRWLAAHLDEYLARWIGFARLPELSVERTLGNAVFRTVVAAQTSGFFPKEEWDAFKNTVEWIRRHPEKEDLVLIERAFVTFERRLLELL
jgi:hypothetical protein